MSRRWSRRNGAVGVLCVVVFGLAIFALWRTHRRPSVEGSRTVEVDSEPVVAAVAPPELAAGSVLPPRPTGNEAEPGAPERRRIRGRVVVAGSSLPVAGARVFLPPSGTSRVAGDDALVTDRTGAFEGPVPGSWTGVLHAWADGFQPWVGKPDLGAEVLVALSAGAFVRGRVVDERGNGVPDAVVWASRPGNRSAWPHTSRTFALERGDGAMGRTDAEGSFSMAGLQAAATYDVYASKEGYGDPSAGEAAQALGGAGDVVVVLRRGTRVNLVVRSSSGEVLPRGAFRPMFRTPKGFGYSLPSVAPPTGRASDDEAVTRLLWVRTSLDAARPAGDVVVEGEIVSVGHVPKATRWVVPEGGSLDVEEVLATSVADARLTPVWFEVALIDGTPVTGLLLFQMERSEIERGPLALTLHEGRATEPIPLLAGDYSVRPTAGTSPETAAFWPKVAQQIRFSIFGLEPRRVPIRLEGNPVFLRVVDARGHEVRGYDLRVASDGAVGELPWARRWDARWRNGPVREVASPMVLVPPGETKVQVSAPGQGGASGTFTADGSGRAIHLKLALREAEELQYVPPPALTSPGK